MLKAIHCDTQDHVFRHLTNLEQAREVKNLPNALLWLDLQSPGEQELVTLGQEFGLHPLAIEDATREHQRPKVEEYEHFYFVVFYSVSLAANAAGLDICELDMFLGKNSLMTDHTGHILELDEVEQRWTRNANQLEWGVLLYTLLDTIVDRYFPVVDEMVNQAEELEDYLRKAKTDVFWMSMSLSSFWSEWPFRRRSGGRRGAGDREDNTPAPGEGKNS